MKIKYGIILACLFVIAAISANAITGPKPLTIVPLDVVDFDRPMEPGTSTEGECMPYEVANEYCSGDIRHYTQCIKTASGGVWQVMSEDCKGYGSNVNCLAGRCQKMEDTAKAVFYVIGTVALGIFIWKKIRRKIK